MPKKKAKSVESIKHKAGRKNIPTEELKSFMSKEHLREDKVLYPRDPSLDPQLVWKGKDQQDSEDLAVPSVPIYIQEKIHPQALIDDIRKEGGRKDPTDDQVDLFGDFNGLDHDRDKLIDFYQHEQHWTNRMILGDSLLVMNSLAEREGLRGKVQMIYLDPPYGIKFGSNWQVSTRKRDVKDGSVSDATRQPEQVKAFRDTWELGIHSYLSYLRDRFIVARDLLTESGSIFVQIGDENVHLVRSLLDEVFGSENFCSEITFLKTTGATASLLATASDYILWYGKDKNNIKYNELYQEKAIGQEGAKFYEWIQNNTGEILKVKDSNVLQENYRAFALSDMTSQTPSESITYTYKYLGINYTPKSRGWRTTVEGMDRLRKADRIFPRETSIRYKIFFDDYKIIPFTNNWFDTRFGGFVGDSKIYVVQTLSKVIERCVLMSTDPGDIVLDPTCGSGATAYVAEQWGRRWITIDTSRVALALARTRLMSAKYPYFHLVDSPDGQKKLAEIAGTAVARRSTSGDIRQGFVYKRIPHITLKGIANNDEIDTIYDRWQQKMEPVREKLNTLLKQTWEEWEIPRDAETAWPDKAQQLHATWWQYRIQRQKEIDASIARHADSETLYDQPYEDNNRIRVTGPFTVESLSPHRRMSVDEAKARARGESGELEGIKVATHGPDKFAHAILENLRKAGVQNTIKNERLKFDTLDPFPGQYVHAEGEYTEKDGRSVRVAVCIGPEFGTVDSALLWEAAKEASKTFDMLLLCGFAFEADVAEEAKKMGKLTVLPVKMNPDLAMGDELLKKTGAGNLFMIFGEPDLTIHHLDDGNLQVEIRGLDIYDPTTGQVRSSSIDDIACWFIDTDYNSDSFFVRHAYFTGSDHPYDRLKKALKAEIDEEAWSALYQTQSRPFTMPESGRIAVKVINHYGDEVLKVYSV